MVSAAHQFISTLNANQQALTLFPFDGDERYNFHYFPINDRKGLPLDQMNEKQKKGAMDLIAACLNAKAVKKVKAIIELEILLKEIEKRKPDDRFRDPGKYYLAIFGVPGDNTIWGWRFEGHHVSFNFSARNKLLVAGTPAFLGANPAVVQDGPAKGSEILKDEKEMGFQLLHMLSDDQLKTAVIDAVAPSEIITGVNRKAMIAHPSGLLYSKMNATQQQQLLALVSLYVHRFTKSFADNMLREIQKAGLNNLYFAWAGKSQPGIGNPHYYRIQGPTIIIEYDNTQNNANHVHTVVRDLQHDFGGDELLQHYKDKGGL